MGANLPFFFREVSQSLRRNILLNIASMTTVMVLTFILGFFILAINNINYISREIMRKANIIKVVLAEDLSLKKAGQLKFRILKHPDVETVRYISKEAGFRKLKQKMKGKVSLANLTYNPIPDVLEVEVRNLNKILSLEKEIDKYPGVIDTISGGKKIIESLIELSGFLWTAGVIIIVMLLFSAVFLISNTIRLTVFSRRKEIAIMELVGAAQWFIRGPFLIEGLLHGVIGAGISILMLNFFYVWMAQWMEEYMQFILIMTPGEALPALSLTLLAVGMLVGSIASYFSVNKYLKI